MQPIELFLKDICSIDFFFIYNAQNEVQVFKQPTNFGSKSFLVLFMKFECTLTGCTKSGLMIYSTVIINHSIAFLIDLIVRNGIRATNINLI